ncbi:MAG: flagellar M-ring protein FliF C-terminal domain-containing protein [Lachnospiraceae bacterium]
MEKIKELLEKIKNLTRKTKRNIIIGTIVVIAFAVGVAVVLNNKPYAVMFSDVSNEEAQQIITKLQDSGTEYQYRDGNILVKEEVLDATKAEMVFAGYPTSGFTYDVFKDNAGLMTTDSDKKTYQLYELQDRIGATIRLFDGVKDAKVNIALGKDDKYALKSNEEESKATDGASATATVIMKDGGSPTSEQAVAIQRLVSRSIQGLTFQNVSVFDGNGVEVSADTSSSGSSSGTDSTKLAELVENQISRNVMNVLVPIYGPGNVRVSAKGIINMEQLVRETTEYTTPEKKDENDKTGIVQKESGSGANTGATTAGGVAGTETNADVPTYNTGTAAGADGYAIDIYYCEFFVYQIKEQGTINPGVLEDLTVSVAINGKDFGTVRAADLKGLIGNAAGIAEADRQTKIAVVSTPFYEEPKKEAAADSVAKYMERYMSLIIIGIVLFVILIIVLVILKKKKKRKKRTPEIKDSYVEVASTKSTYNQDIIDLQNEKGMELKQNVRDFAEENPEISAQLLKKWLNGGGQDGNE